MERYPIPQVLDHVCQLGDKVLVLMEKQINSLIGIYRGSLTVLSFDVRSRIIFIEEEPDKSQKRYKTEQVKPYVEESGEFADSFMSPFKKAIDNYRDVDDGGTHYSSTKYGSELAAVTTRSVVTSSQTTEHSSPNVNNAIKLEGPLFENT